MAPLIGVFSFLSSESSDSESEISSISCMGIWSESSESGGSSAVAFCDPRFCLEGLERHAQLAWMLHPWLIKLWGCLLYYWGFFADPKVPRQMPCDVLYNQPNPHCSV